MRPRPRPRRYDRHGLTALKRTVATLGGRVLDGRFAVARELREWRAGLERDLGGDLSTQERVLVDLAVTQKLLLGSIDSWLLVQPSLVNARKRAVLPVVKDRQALVDSLSRIMGQLGLKRRAVDGGDASRALLEVKRLREAAAELARDAAGGDPSQASDSGGGTGTASVTPPRAGASVRCPPAANIPSFRHGGGRFSMHPFPHTRLALGLGALGGPKGRGVGWRLLLAL